MPSSRPGTSAVVSETRTPPANPLVERLPRSWGNPELAPRPAASQAVPPPSSALVFLPPAPRLTPLPEGRIQIGEGRVDLQSLLRYGAYYIVCAPASGIVEYLYPANGVTHIGQPLVRVYEASILADLRIGESIMARFATGPFVIAPRPSSLPPMPPMAFPSPTEDPQLGGPVAPTAANVSSSAPALTPERRPTLQQEGRPRLARAVGLARLSATESAAAESQSVSTTAEKAPDVHEITQTSGKLSAAQQRLQEIEQALQELEGALQETEKRLEEARADVAARERLFRQGVLARKAWEAAQQMLQERENERESLERKRTELREARALAAQRVKELEGRIQQQVAARRSAIASAPRTEQRASAAALMPAMSQTRDEAKDEATDPPSALSFPNARERFPRVPTANANQLARPFPSPTRRPQPQLAQLPRQPIAGAERNLLPPPEIPSVPPEIKRLAAPRWTDQAAPTEGLVVRQLTPPGAQVTAGQPLLEIANRNFARVYADVEPESVHAFGRGAPVRITFAEYPGVQLEGWINDIFPEKKCGRARVEMIVTAQKGYFPEDTYASLEWLALAAPLESNEKADAVAPATIEQPRGKIGPTTVAEILPLAPRELASQYDKDREAQPGEFRGLLRFGEIDQQAANAPRHPVYAQRLAKLRQWRESFTEGMQTAIFGQLVLTYPRDTETGRAIERMALGLVSHEPNMCAATLREALGWGLGDAAEWLIRLPERGYVPRPDGLARPGDILVWPFTYGPRRSQHIGIAVNQGGKLMLLSNLNGVLGTSELVGGYVAFYRPTAKERPTAARHLTAQQPTTKR